MKITYSCKFIVFCKNYILQCDQNVFIAYGVKLLNADLLRQRVPFLNHENTFSN